MRMEISESNDIIKNAIKQSILSKIAIYKGIEEFGLYKYFFHNEDMDNNYNSFTFSFYAPDFEAIYNFSGKEWLEKDFAAFPHSINRIVIDKVTYSVSLIIDVSKYLSVRGGDKETEDKQLVSEMEEYAEMVSSKFASFSTDFYASAIRKYINEIKNKQVSNPIICKLNSTNTMYLIPDTEKLLVVYGLNYESKTDSNLAKLFFRELDDAKFGLGGTVDIKYLINQFPDFLLKLEKNVNAFNSGFVAFSKFILIYFICSSSPKLIF